MLSAADHYSPERYFGQKLEHITFLLAPSADKKPENLSARDFIWMIPGDFSCIFLPGIIAAENMI